MINSVPESGSGEPGRWVHAGMQVTAKSLPLASRLKKFIKKEDL